jgi:hypothetical protein
MSPEGLDLRIKELAKASSNCKRLIHPLAERILHKDYDGKGSVGKQNYCDVSLKGLVAKTN